MKKLVIAMLALMLFAVPASGSYGRRAYLVSIVDVLQETNDEVTSFTVNIAGSTAATIYANASTTTAATNPIVDSSTATDITTLTDGYVTFWYAGATCDIILSNGTHTKTHSGVTPRNTRLMYDSVLYTAMTEFELLDAESISFGTHDDWVAQSAVATIMTWTPLANNSAFNIGTTGAVSDVNMFGDTPTCDLMWDASADTLRFRDNAVFSIGSGDDFYIAHNGTTTTITGAATYASASIFSTDVTFTGNAYNVEWDNSSDTLHLLDNAELGIGGASAADGDIVLKWDAVDLDVVPAAATAIWKWGNGTNDLDMWWYGGAVGDYMLWDEGAATLAFFDAHVLLKDDATVTYGTHLDFVISSSTAATLDIIALVTDSTAAVNFGADGVGMDLVLYGETASQKAWWDASTDQWFYGADAEGVDVTFYGDTTLINMMWDESANLLSFTGAVNVMEFKGAAVDAHETLLGFNEPTQSNTILMPDDTGQILYHADAGTASLSGAGAIPITDAVVLLTTTGTDAWTLADGYAGQILSVVVVTDGGTGTITPASCTGAGWATMVFTNDGEGASFMFVDATIGWVVLGTYGLSTQPLITQ